MKYETETRTVTGGVRPACNKTRLRARYSKWTSRAAAGARTRSRRTTRTSSGRTSLPACSRSCSANSRRTPSENKHNVFIYSLYIFTLAVCSRNNVLNILQPIQPCNTKIIFRLEPAVPEIRAFQKKKRKKKTKIIVKIG